ncbi:hypothetical protein ABW21_db0207022 [Orbilia brochopaga]|nr:hypothetical protein ABW21_db0207022 [Drechslerella brochopaga]
MRSWVFLTALLATRAMAGGADTCIKEECLEALSHCSKHFVKTVSPAAVTVTTTCTKGKKAAPAEKTAEAEVEDRRIRAALRRRGDVAEHQKPCGGPENFTKYCGLIGIKAKTVTCTRTPTVTVTANRMDVTTTEVKVRSTVTVRQTISKAPPPPPPKKPIGFILRCTNPPKSGESYIELVKLGEKPAWKLSKSPKQATVWYLKDGFLLSKAGQPGTIRNFDGSFLVLNDKSSTPVGCNISPKKILECVSGAYKEFGSYVNGNDKTNTRYIFMGTAGVEWKRFNGERLYFETVDVY